MTTRTVADRDTAVAAVLARTWFAATAGRTDALPLLRVADVGLSRDLRRRLARPARPHRVVVAVRCRRDERGVEASVRWRDDTRTGVVVLRWTEADGTLRLHVLEDPAPGRAGTGRPPVGHR